MDSREVIPIHPIAGEMIADKLKVIESMTDELQTLRAKVASAEVLVEALETIATESHPELWQVEVAIKALSTYDKLSEVKNDTK